MRTAEVYMYEELAGHLIEVSRGHFIFRYESTYFADVSKPSISLTLPKSQSEYTSGQLFPFFSNLVSEGGNLLLQERVHKIDKNDEFGLLLATAQFDTIGAVYLQSKDT